ncbi:unnamed protein product [Alopecurus aequalis]
MASGSPCSGGSGPLPRGLISCSHCRPHDAPTVRLPDHDFRHAVQKLIDGFYEEAFDRLPRKSDAMPDLLRLLTTGGSCLGLLDPVSNIILNTLALLPYPAASVANLSCISLVHFLVAYFGCLTSQQAFRYLYFAGADLPLAVMLVQHDLYQQPHALDPDSARTQAALKSAATKANHPEPNTLVQLMAIRLYTDDHRFALLKKKFAGDRTASLSSKNVRAIHHLLHRPYDEGGMLPRIPVVERTTTSVDVSSDGSTITTTTTTVRRVSHRITSLRHIDDMAAKLASCLPKAAYGNTDLVSLHVVSQVNSIWYNKHGCPLPESDHVNVAMYTDILDPLSLLRTELHSLRGLTKIAAFAEPQFSVAACALENLCSAKCDIVNMLSSSLSSTQRNPFQEADVAARHPLPLQLGDLHQQLLLMPVERNKLLSLMTEARTSGTVLPIDEIASVLDMVSSSSSRAQTTVLVQAPKLCVKALSEISSHRSDYEKRSSWFRSNLEQLLKEYASQHLWEPKYTLDFVVGVEESRRGPHPHMARMCYHVNFMATCGLRLQKTLFFAEFWSFGRCYYGVHKTRRIVYPDRSEYILPDISSGKVDSMLEMDLVYFSSQRVARETLTKPVKKKNRR